MFAPNIVIDITYYLFEAGQKLVRSGLNYFVGRKGKFCRFFYSLVIDRDRTTFLMGDNASLFIRLFSGLIVFQSYQDDCWMIMNDSVQRDAVYVRDLNIASSEYRTDDIDLGKANRSAA